MEGRKTSQQHPRLLIVEDNEAQLRTLTAIMEAEGFEIVACSTAAEALKGLGSGEIDVTVTDLRLPDVGEDEWLKSLAPFAEEIPLILNTGYASLESARKAVNVGAFAYVEKGGDPVELIGHVHRAIQTRLRRYAQDLEEAVEERTRELRKANRALVQEIAQRNRLEEEARSIKTQMEFILGATKTGLDIIDGEFNIRYIDPEWQKVYGDHTGRKCYEYFMGRDDPCPGCGVVKALKNKTITVTEEVLPKENSRPIQVTTIPFRSDAGEWLVAEVNVDITEREKAEEALRESEARYKALFAGAPEGILVADLQTKQFRYANPAMCRMFGYTQEELLQLGVADIHPKESLDHVLAEFEAQARGEKLLSRDLPCVRRDGTMFSADISAVMIVLDGRECNLGFFTDITERKRAQEALEKSARLLMDTGEMARVGGWELDLATKEVSWTEEVGRIHGVEPGFRPKLEEALKFYPPESRPAVEAVLRKAAETGEPYDLESLFIPSGSKDKIWVRSLGRAVYKGGQIVKLAGTFQNIDKYKRVEEALRESEERFRTLVEAVTDYTYRVTVREGRVVETTHGPGCLGVTGYSPEELHAAPELWFRMVHPGDRPAVFDQAAKLSSGQKPPPLEHRIIRKKGGTRWVRNTAVPRYDDRGQYTGYEGLIQDITEYRRLQDQFAQAQKMEAIGLLAGGVAHDFRNQLTVIQGYAEMLLRRSLMKDGGREPLELMLEAADRSVTIARQLVAFSRQQTLRPEVVSVDSLTGDMMKSLARTVGEDIRLSIVPCGDLWDIRVDTGQFQQALLNLILNARDAMPQGGQLTIETENIVLDEDFVRWHGGASAGRYVVLTVADTGAGMSPETLGRVFEPFFTTKPVGEGTGLGLAMVHGFVAQSGGFIEVESQPGQPAGHGIPTEIGTVPGGTTFRLYLPAVEDVAESPRPTPRAPGLPRGSGTILVVEDEDAIRRMLPEVLGECGYTVLTAGDAQEAMALVESAKEKIDLLITDVVMPGWSGPELAKHFHAARPGVPILLISGHTGKALTEHGVIPPDVNLLVKPFSLQTLAQTVQKALRQPTRP